MELTDNDPAIGNHDLASARHQYQGRGAAGRAKLEWRRLHAQRDRAHPARGCVTWQDRGEDLMVHLVRPFSRRAALALAVAWLLTFVGAAVRPSLAAENAPAAASTVSGAG